MILRQTGAIFLDAYRELNSKKLFWVVLFISLAVVIAIAIPSNNERGITMFGLTVDMPLLSTKVISRVGFYKFLFSKIGISLWLTWGASILALISTASMIPDLVTGGSIELSLSRPISRFRLYFTKYCAGLIFVGVQVGIFALGTFIVILVRGGKAEPSVFLSVPLVVATYSFLFSVCSLIGLITRSALTAILFTMIFWLFLFALNTTEHILLSQRLDKETGISRAQSTIKQIDSAIAINEQRLALAKSTAKPAPVDEKSVAPAPAPSPAQPALEAPDVQPKPPEPDGQPPGRRRWGTRNRLADMAKEALATMAPTDDTVLLERRLKDQQASKKHAEEDLHNYEESLQSVKPWHWGFYAAKTLLPKTSESADLVERWVIDKSDMDAMLKMLDEGMNNANSREFNEALLQRSAWWVLGTSLSFEAFILLLSGWIFVRRDF